MQLKTQKGTIIKRSKYGVGKEIGGCIYVHRDYAGRVIPPGIKVGAYFVTFLRKYTYLKWNKKTNALTFFKSPNFDTANEPTVSEWTRIDTNGNVKTGKSNQIIHHKWLFVDDDYKGFDVQESYNRSKRWLKIKNINFSKIGNKDYWYPLLKKNKINF